jgi:ubiquitin-protein ligase E3 A
LLHDFITLKYLEEADPDMFVPNRNLLVTSAVQVMGYLHEINQSKHFVKYTAFFSDTIDNSVSPKDDYINYKRGDGFAFCNYPFVLQTETKSQILQIESAVQQYVQRAESMNMMQFGVPVTPYLVLNIFRQNLIYSSLKSLEQYSARELKKELKVKFVGEEGVDEGGVQKEWFQLLVKKIFDPQFGMFIEDHETRTHWFNNKSQDFEEFELIGKLLGLAIYNGVILDLHFPFVIYKKLLGEKPTIDDLSQTHPVRLEKPRKAIFVLF